MIRLINLIHGEYGYIQKKFSVSRALSIVAILLAFKIFKK